MLFRSRIRHVRFSQPARSRRRSLTILAADVLSILAFLMLASAQTGGQTVVYANDFSGPLGSVYPEWSSTGYTYFGNGMSGSGPQPITNVESANHARRFLGEFGGPQIVTGPPFVRVNETICLTLNDLAPHTMVTVSFDLYILKSWDGNNPHYGPDRWSLRVTGGPTLLDTTFSNNNKQDPYNFSPQDYPVPNSPYQTGAFAIDTLGYTFYGDAIYRLSYTFAHTGSSLTLNFASSMYEGKGTDDESWGLANVRVVSDAPSLLPIPTPAPRRPRPPSHVVLSNLSVRDTPNAAKWSLQHNLRVGDIQYGDRNYTFTSVPDLVAGAPWIRTGNDSKSYTGNPLVTFDINQAADVFVAFDTRIALPAWLDTTWTALDTRLVNSESPPTNYGLYVKRFPAGTVSLGPRGGTDGSLYTVIVQ